jgi:DNA-binding MarR family transcriptional regulator
VWGEYGLTLEEYESARRANRRAIAEAREQGKAPTPMSLEARVLGAIQKHPGAGLKQLARVLKMRPATVSRAISDLEKQGHLTRRKNGQKHTYEPVPRSVPPYSE